MPVKASPRYIFTLILVSTLLGLTFVHLFRRQAIGTRDPNYDTLMRGDSVIADQPKGSPIMPRLGNETAKAELGRATWKYFHTVMARYPETPNVEEKTALRDYIHLFQRLYPCGECSEHFGQIIDDFPPQVSSRNAASAWACHVHNEVNKSLKKPIFDCKDLGDVYDCGCGDDEPSADTKSGKPEMSAERKDTITGRNGREPNEDKVTEAAMSKDIL